MSQYHYKPLGDTSIRTLELLPGEFVDPLKGCIKHRIFIPFRRKEVIRRRWMPIYEALSYAWGEQDELQILTIVDDSTGDEDVLRIGKNLASALRDLRSTSESRVIWCDAVCINQHDLAERATQVQCMADIFRHADRVVVWLAPDNERVNHAFRLLDEFGSHVGYNVELAKCYAHEGMNTTYMEHDYLLPLTADDWKCVVDLVSLPWFKRLWVRQEIILANASAVLTSGRHQVLWSRACSAIAYFDNKLKRGKTVVKAAQRPPTTSISIHMMRFIECQDVGKTAYHIVALMRDCQCTDSRDRIYGTLGLQEDLDVRIDYRKTVREVHMDWALACYRHHLGLQFLELCEMASNPSWVPNLAKPPTFQLSRMLSHSAANTDAVLKVLTDKSCMMLATRYGTISRHTSAMPHEPDIEVMQNTLESWARNILPHRDTESDVELAIDNLARTISGGRALDNYEHARFNISRVKNVLLPGNGESSSNAEQGTIFPPLFYDLSKILPGAAVFATDDVHFGLGSSAANVDDEIWVVLGFHLPVVMRRVEESKYTVVGPCYIPQLSHGEAILGPFRDGWKMMFHVSGEPFFVGPYLQHTLQDPRVDERLPPGWKQMEDKRGSQFFWRKEEHDDWRSKDPRTTPEWLMARGVKLEMLTVV